MTNVTIDTLAWEMAQWEIHALRNELNVATMQVDLYAYYHPDAQKLMDDIHHSKDLFDADSLRALRDPEMRKIRY